MEARVYGAGYKESWWPVSLVRWSPDLQSVDLRYLGFEEVDGTPLETSMVIGNVRHASDAKLEGKHLKQGGALEFFHLDGWWKVQYVADTGKGLHTVASKTHHAFCAHSNPAERM